MLSGEPTRTIQAYSSSGLASASPSTQRELDLGTEHWGSGKGTRSHGSGSALMPSTTHSWPGYRAGPSWVRAGKADLQSVFKKPSDGGTSET